MIADTPPGADDAPDDEGGPTHEDAPRVRVPWPRFFVTCERGAEGALRRELVDLRIRAPKGAHAGVSFMGPFSDGMKVCLHARTAMRVRMEIARFEATDASSLYDGARAVDWSAFLTPATTLAVRAHVRDNPQLAHTGFAALKIKDALVDAVRDRVGTRPNVDPKSPDVPVVLDLNGTQAVLSLDLAGEPLHRRGYRVAMTEAPLKETAAAALLALGGVAHDRPFVDPMAGSGTLAIEHALAARQKAPGLSRGFAFLRWPDPAPRADWPRLVDEARANEKPHAPAVILASDRDPDAVAAARANAHAAGVDGDIRFDVRDVAALAPGTEAGTLVTNPPYGERLDGGAGSGRGDDDGLDARPSAALLKTYDAIARTAHKLWGWKIVLLAARPELARAMGIPAGVMHRLKNGGIDVRLLVYELGTQRTRA